MDMEESTTMHSGDSRSTDSRSCASEQASSISQPHTLSASLKRAGGGSFCVNTTAFCNTWSSSGYVAPSPNGHLLHFYSWGLTKERSLVANPAFQVSFGVVTVVRCTRKPFLIFIIYHAIGLASVNFLFRISQGVLPPRLLGTAASRIDSMKRFAIAPSMAPWRSKLFAYTLAFSNKCALRSILGN